MKKSSVFDFIIMVSKMRDMQRQYFKTRDKGVLGQAIQYEGKVDDYIKQFNEEINDENN
jgi:hypothetical protein